jgi:GDP-D-mannose dehydratase
MAELLLKKGYRVIGVSRKIVRVCPVNLHRLNISEKVEIIACDMRNA